MRYILLLGLGILSSSLLAEPVMPNHCVSVPLGKDSSVLKAKKSSLFMIYNRSKHDLWLTHPVDNQGASAGWTSQLASQKWSALAVSGDFAINCVESYPGHEQEINCSEAIEVCQYQKVNFPEDAEGSFWAGENMSKEKLISHLEKRGFKLPAHEE